ncbi:hypothetical protein [Dyadobacter sp. 22481]|uniref:hypothetical protein n=1 Tax=Dyadobacter sp. 22481 TaxID=3453926 RepID=UPI003F83A0F8
MAKKLTIIFPGVDFKEQILLLQSTISDAKNKKQSISLLVIMHLLNLTAANRGLRDKLTERGSFNPKGNGYVNTFNALFQEEIHDLDSQLGSVTLSLPDELFVELVEISPTELLLDFKNGELPLIEVERMPDLTDFSANFILEAIKFHPNGNDTILKEENDEGEIKIVVDYTRPTSAGVEIVPEGQSLRTKLYNTLSLAFADRRCGGGGPPITPPPPPADLAKDNIEISRGTAQVGTCVQQGFGFFIYNLHTSRAIQADYLKEERGTTQQFSVPLLPLSSKQIGCVVPNVTFHVLESTKYI